MTTPADMIDRVRRALGRTSPLPEPPRPLEIEEPVVRLVHSEIGLTDLFARMARQSQMSVELVAVDGLAAGIASFLNARGAIRVACSGGGILDRIDLPTTLQAASIEARRWDEMTLDELYDFDAAVTDVTYAVAETGSLVVRATPQHGRALSLVPPVHVAVVEPKQILPDLVDLFEQLARDGADNTVLITGPSKTADIELTLVTGVHGPGIVQVFILQ